MIKKLIGFVIFGILFTACEKTNNSDEQPYKYLLSYEKAATYSKSQILTGISLSSYVYPQLGDFSKFVQSGTSVYRIYYKTTFLNKKVTASGLISIPETDSLHPIISFHYITNTCNNQAPSVSPDAPFNVLISNLASAGNIVFIADHIGFGSSNNFKHPYLLKSANDSVYMDFLRAGTEFLSGIKRSYSNKLYLLGYSQGAWSGLSFLKHLEQNPTTFELSGTSVGATPVNILELGKTIFNKGRYVNSYFFPYYIFSRIENDILKERLSTFFLPEVVPLIPSVFDGSTCNIEANEYFSMRLDSVLTPSMVTNFETDTAFYSLRNEIAQSNIAAWKVESPLHLFHCTGDSTIFYQQSENFYNDAISNYGSTSIELDIINDSLNHVEAFIPWFIKSIDKIKSWDN